MHQWLMHRQMAFLTFSSLSTAFYILRENGRGLMHTIQLGTHTPNINHTYIREPQNFFELACIHCQKLFHGIVMNEITDCRAVCLKHVALEK
jgi:hypothetical protein